MSTGPIEFVRSVNVDTLGETEYGGGPGLVQGQPNGRGSADAQVHLGRLRTDERRGALVRSKSGASETLEVDEDGAKLIVRTIHAEGVDPVTGLGQEEIGSEEVTGDSVPPVAGV
jgi:hypothetical protein